MSAAEHLRVVERRKAFKVIISFLSKQQSKGNHNWTPAKMHEAMEDAVDDVPSMPRLRVRLTQLQDARILSKTRSQSWNEGDVYCLTEEYAEIFAKEFPEVLVPRDAPKPISQWPLHALFFGQNVDEPLMLT